MNGINIMPKAFHLSTCKRAHQPDRHSRAGGNDGLEIHTAASRKMKRFGYLLQRLLFCILLSFTTTVFTSTNSLNDVLSSSRNHIPLLTQPTVLPVSEAFGLTILVNTIAQEVELHWRIAPNYYLYQDKFKITSSSPLNYDFPSGTPITDEFFGEQIVYYQDVTLTFSLPADLPTTFPLTVDYQGCAEAGFCYPPMTETWEINKQTGAVSIAQPLSADGPAEFAEMNQLQNASAFTLSEILADSQLGWVLLIFYGLGLLLTFTPCVLPMIPILSSIIIGQQTPSSSGRAFLLSLSYVAGMAITYTLAGVFAGLAGQTLQSYLQTPLFIGISATFLVLLALNLFGCYHLQLPARWHHSISQVNQRLHGGRYISAILLGLLSALVVSPCVTAPLIGALTYISTTGDAWLGGSALLALALGMGTPLLIIGTLGPHLLPRAGTWLISVQRVFGVLLIAVAIWLITRLVSTEITAVLWGVGIVIIASYLGALQVNTPAGWPRLWQGIAWIALLTGALLFLHGAYPLINTQIPLPQTTTTMVIPAHQTSAFIPVKTWADVEQRIQQSTKPVLLDFYAQWCVTCQIIEQRIFPDPEVAPLLQQFTLLRADVTAQDTLDRALQQKVGVFAPPALLFFAGQGNELTDKRIVGDVSAEMLAAQLRTILKSMSP